jgi:hypothetical protein
MEGKLREMIKIPEDLRAEHKKMHHYSLLDYEQVAVPPERVKQLIERIAQQEADVERLKAPVSDEEVAAVEEELGYPFLEINTYAAVCSAIIASRTTQPAPQEEKE